jgi:hypothetical protein
MINQTNSQQTFRLVIINALFTLEKIFLYFFQAISVFILS